MLQHVKNYFSNWQIYIYIACELLFKLVNFHLYKLMYWMQLFYFRFVRSTKVFSILFIDFLLFKPSLFLHLSFLVQYFVSLLSSCSFFSRIIINSRLQILSLYVFKKENVCYTWNFLVLWNNNSVEFIRSYMFIRWEFVGWIVYNKAFQ